MSFDIVSVMYTEYAHVERKGKWGLWIRLSNMTIDAYTWHCPSRLWNSRGLYILDSYVRIVYTKHITETLQ